MRQDEALIDMEEAAQLLGYSVSGLRKIVNRSRRKLRRAPAMGPMVQFFQAGPKAPIKFKRQWIEDFIRQYTNDPTRPMPQQTPPLPKVHGRAAGLIPPDAGPAIGFDPALYDV